MVEGKGYPTRPKKSPGVTITVTVGVITIWITITIELTMAVGCNCCWTLSRCHAGCVVPKKNSVDKQTRSDPSGVFAHARAWRIPENNSPWEGNVASRVGMVLLQLVIRYCIGWDENKINSNDNNEVQTIWYRQTKVINGSYRCNSENIGSCHLQNIWLSSKVGEHCARELIYTAM
jgi:hypothetical protein